MKIFSIIILLIGAIIIPFINDGDCTASILVLMLIAAIIFGDESSKNKSSKNKRRRK